jgi:hypothetical protein
VAGFAETMSSIGRTLGGALSSVATGVGSVLANPAFQQAAIGLGTQYISSKLIKQSSPPPSAYARMPGPGLRLPAGSGGQVYAGAPAVAAPMPTYGTPPTWGAPVRRVNFQQPTAAGFMPGPLPSAGAAAVMGQLLPEGFQMPQGFGGFVESITAPGTIGGGIMSEVGERLVGAVAGRPSMFRYGGQRARAMTLLEAPHPETGQMHYWRHVGRPILFSGDVATAKRVRRISTKLSSQMGTRRRCSR